MAYGGSGTEATSGQHLNSTLQSQLRYYIRDSFFPLGTSLAAFKGVLNQSSLNYSVDIKAGTCSCSDQTQRRTVCKHMFAVFHHHSAHVSFQDLPSSLVEAPMMILDPHVSPVLSLDQFKRQQDVQLQRMDRERRQQPVDIGMEEDTIAIPTLPSRSLLTSALDIWEELKSALYSMEAVHLAALGADMEDLKGKHLRPSAAWREGAALTAGPKAVAKSIRQKIMARTRKEGVRRMGVAGPNFKKVRGPGRKKGKQPAFHSLQECEEDLFPLDWQQPV